MDNCPRCNYNFVGEDIYQYFLEKYTNEGRSRPITIEEILKGFEKYPEQYEPLPYDLLTMSEIELDAWNTARMYGWTENNKISFRKEIGIETEQNDGITWWKCPECKAIWARFSWSNPSYLDEEDKENIIEV